MTQVDTVSPLENLKCKRSKNDKDTKLKDKQKKTKETHDESYIIYLVNQLSFIGITSQI